MTGPFAAAARGYLGCGWGSPVPLPPGKKSPPAKGFTGPDAPDVSAADVETWCSDGKPYNIGMRLAEGVIGVDCDAHKGDRERAAWQALIDANGPLPDAPWSTSRDDGVSGIRLFRVPPDYVPADMGDAGEVIRRGYRYAVVPPSISPSPPRGSGQPYRWVNLPAGAIPQLDDLPKLPGKWQEALRARADGGGQTTWTDPDIDALVTRGIPDGTKQRELLRDTMFALVRRGETKASGWAHWQAITARTRQRPGDPWTRDHFERYWDDAAAKLGEQAPPAAEPGGAEFRRFDLAGLARVGVPAPVLLCGGLLYAGGLHSLAGPPDSGKTTLAWAWAVSLIRDGQPVAVFDEEAGPEQTTEKLLALGVKPDEMDAIRYYPFPGRSWGAADVAALAAEIMTGPRPALVIWDSSAVLLARAGLDENSAADVTRFWARVLAPCARQGGAAVLVVDHDPKDGAPSRYARGSGAKLAATDVAFKLEAVQPFSRDTDGVLSLTVAKDRRGWLHRWHGIRVAHSPLALAFTAESARDRTGSLPPAQAKLLDALDDTPRPAAELVDRVAARHGHGLKRETVSRALNALLDAGLADRLDTGAGKAHLWTRFPRSDP